MVLREDFLQITHMISPVVQIETDVRPVKYRNMTLVADSTIHLRPDHANGLSYKIIITSRKRLALTDKKYI